VSPQVKRALREGGIVSVVSDLKNFFFWSNCFKLGGVGRGGRWGRGGKNGSDVQVFVEGMKSLSELVNEAFFLPGGARFSEEAAKATLVTIWKLKLREGGPGILAPGVRSPSP